LGVFGVESDHGLVATAFHPGSLPIIVTFAIATLFQSKRIDDLSKRIDDLRDSLGRRLDAIEQRLARIENLLADHDRRITAL
jgi:hypothetical protein